ncbi:MAG: VCBS repeat-containing protein [Bacteroidetes bacterium]|nr:VCBS repeat-containing protein [Bacteroidota bacterium]
MTNSCTRTLLICLIFLSANVSAQNPFSFTNANAKFSSATFRSGNALSVVDMNGDGMDDIARLNQGNALFYTLQRTNQTFNNISAGNAGSSGSAWAMVVGDVDNNGVRDVAIGFGSNSYLMKANTALTTFTLSSALPKPGSYFPQNMNFSDIDNDGFIDLYVCNDIAPSVMYGNNGSGSYPAMTNFFSTANTGSDGSGNYGSIFTDIDNDGDIDLYVPHCRQSTPANDGRRLDMLHINNGNGTWTLDDAPVPGARGLRNYDMTWTASFEDIDNDGDLDCVLTETDVASKLLLNDGNGYFTNITAGSGFVLDITPYQSKMEDLDNDGFVDIIISGDDARVFRNNHNNTFTLVNGLFDNNDMLSFATGDLNHDGKIDLYSSYGGVYNSPSSSVNDVLWMNSTDNDNHFITFNLQGTISNRDALGARVEVYGAWGKQIREVRAGESYGTTNTFSCHFGLGTATVVDSAIIRWPKGLVTKLYNRPADQFITVIEGQCSSPDNLISFNGPSVLCAGQSVTMTAPAGYNYLWSTGATTQSITTSTMGEYTVRVTDAGSGCSSISKMVQVMSQPDETPTVTASGNTTFCEGGNVVLTGSSATSYLWSNGATTQSTTISQAGTYTLTIQGACASFTSTPITVSPIPSHVINANPVSVCNSTPIALTLTATSTGSTYWYDAQNAVAPIATGDSYATPVLSNNSVTYYVESRDTLFGLSGYVGPEDTSIGGGSNYNTNQYMKFDVLNPSVLKSVKVFSSAAGNRTIELRNSSGTVLQSATVNIAQGAVTVPLNFTLTPGTNYRLGIVGNSNLNLWRSSSGASYPYTLANLVSITGNSANDLARWYFYYNWQIEEEPKVCASVRVPVTASIYDQPSNVVTTSQPTTICPGDSVVLSAEPGWSYNWSNGSTDQSVTVNANGTFTVTVSENGCSATSAPIEVTVSNNAVAGITPSAATTFCAGGSVELTASKGTAYLWSNGATTPSITVNSNGVFTVTVTVSGSCQAISNPTTVVVNTIPSVSFSGLGTTYENTDAPVVLTGTPSGGTFSGTGVSGSSFDPSVAGVGGPYTITYDYTDANGCSASSTAEVSVTLASGILTTEGISLVKIMPNPSNGQFNLSFSTNGSKKVNIAITNTLGQTIYEERNIAVNGNYLQQIGLKNIAKGVYNLTLTADKKQSVYKLMIQ